MSIKIVKLKVIYICIICPQVLADVHHFQGDEYIKGFVKA